MPTLARLRSFLSLPSNHRRQRSEAPSLSSEGESLHFVEPSNPQPSSSQLPSSQPNHLVQQARNRPSDPPTLCSDLVQTPPDRSGLVASSVSAGPTFRDTALASIDDSPMAILQKAMIDFGELITNGRSEPNEQSWFIDICRRVWRRDFGYEYQGYRPTCEFVLNLSIHYMQVKGGKRLTETVFASTVKEMYSHRKSSHPSQFVSFVDVLLVTNTNTPDFHAVCTPDIVFVASVLGRPYKYSTESTRLSGNTTTISHAERRLKKRRKRADQVRAKGVDLDLDFQVASLAVELKTSAFFKQLCQLLAYLVQLFEINGCRLGLTVNLGWFTRFFVDTNTKIYMETTTPSSWGNIVDIVGLRSELSKRTEYMAHNLRDSREATTRPKVDESAAVLLLAFLQTAANLLADLPFRNVELSDIAMSSRLGDLNAGFSDAAVPFPDMLGTDDAALTNRRATARGVRTALDPVLAALEPEAHARLSKAISGAKTAKKEDQGGDRRDNDGDPDDLDGGGDDMYESSDEEDGKAGESSGDDRAGGDTGNSGGAAGEWSSKCRGDGYREATAWGASEAQQVLEADQFESSWTAEDCLASPHVSSSSSSSLADSLYDDDVVDRPDPHDPIVPALRRMGLLIEFCSPEDMTAHVERYAAAAAVVRRGQQQRDHTGMASQVGLHAPIIRGVGEDLIFAMDSDMPQTKSTGRPRPENHYRHA